MTANYEKLKEEYENNVRYVIANRDTMSATECSAMAKEQDRLYVELNTLGIYMPPSECHAKAKEPIKKEAKSQYRIVSGMTVGELAEQVNKELEEGWKLQGGLKISNKGFTSIFYQTLTRDKYDND